MAVSWGRGSDSAPFSMSRSFYPAVLWVLLCFAPAFGQTAKQTSVGDVQSSVQEAVRLAQTGHCHQALPGLRKASLRLSDKELKRTVGFAGVRCATVLDQWDVALDFLRILNRDFPRDPEVLYISVHTHSDISTRLAQKLASFAPNSVQAHELNAESLEVRGKWDLAQKEYQAVVQQNPTLPGIHFRLGRLLLSKPDPGPTAPEDAKKEFQEELKIDPNNAGAEYVLGELARQAQQLDEAIQHFSRAAKLDAGFGDAFLGLGSSLMSQKKFSEAVPPLETAVKLEPMNPGAHYNLAMAYARSGRKQDADKEFAIHREMMQKNGGAGAEQGPQPPETPQ
ncbi:MAG: hypothetical protein DMG88_23580 [Acidobacteria bacterium]|nr:MAG: hypothetical protein DMG88_23580 [Acidobacteriota bacterium]